MAESKKKKAAAKPSADTAKESAGQKSAAKHKEEKNNVKTTNQSAARTTPKTGIPLNYYLAVISLALFLVLLVVVINPEGTLPIFIQNIVLGLFGEVGLYVSIPAALYMFVILAFKTRTNMRMRAICLIAFTLVCGTSMQLIVPEQTYGGFFAGIIGLWKGGIEGTSAGLICGALGKGLLGIFGKFLAFVTLILIGVLTLLGSMQITIPSLFRAIQNRPRDLELEEEEPEEVYEPAALLVNHITTKRIEHKRKVRQRRLDEEYEEYEDYVEAPNSNASHAVEQVNQAIGSGAVQQTSRRSNLSLNGIFQQIEGDIDAPVAAAHTARSEEVFEPAVPAVQTRPQPKPVEAPAESIPSSMPAFDPSETIPDAPKTEPKPDKVTAKQARESAVQVAAEVAMAAAEEKQEYCFPPISLLKMPPRSGVNGTEEMKENSRRLNETLESFNIAAHIVNVTRGPSVTRYEVELEKGVKLSKLTNCADDIALSLGASGVRIAAVPGKISVVGIEVPNRAVTTVSLREVIDSDEFSASKGKSSFAVGKDIGGTCIVGNIAKMPHLLIAGTTGSGKSVCMNSIIISLLYKSSPEDVKLIMVDPKMVELANYNGIPHLMIPVVTDPKKAAGALQWAVTEMMRRYKTMSDAGVRDLESYNSIVEAEGGERVPQLIVIIDELADLMLVAAKEVEDSICRIAQMGRASGVHLIIATQRPSADVITGLMKANIPSRIAFSVASAMESRIILDTQGAEKLVGKGDMLYSPIGSGKPLRVQGCFVTDREVEAVTDYVKNHFVADYDQSVMEDIDRKAQQTGKKPAASASDPEPNAAELDGDEMLPAAVEVVLETGQASVSMLQRRLKLGYARAARIVDEMEEKGIVGPFQGSKPRTILVTKEQWAAMQGSSQMSFMDDSGVPEEI